MIHFLLTRSWDELQYQVLGSLPEATNPILAGGPPEVVHHLPRIHPLERMTSSNSEDERCVNIMFVMILVSYSYCKQKMMSLRGWLVWQK
jgi:hypothetical protein